jgi:exodeoxyribonuclease V beta subunit
MSTPTMLQPHDPSNLPLTLPLHGLRVIEASAGTGKTWTLAALYVRLVIGHVPGERAPGSGLYPPQILVMTFTDAATAELRGRIRARLSQAAQFFAQEAHSGIIIDDFLHALRAQLDVVHWPACAQRLGMAAQWMDEAAIFTIHGWSSRMLKTHAFDSASLFQQSRVEDSSALQRMVVQDYWRKWYYPLRAEQLLALQTMGHTPQELLEKIAHQWKRDDKAPHQSTLPSQTPDEAVRAWEVWQNQRTALEAAARAAWLPSAVALVNDAAARKVLKNYRSNWLPGWLDQMAQWAAGDDIKPETLQRFSTTALQTAGWGAAQDHLVFGAVQALCDVLAQQPATQEALLAHAVFETTQAYRAAKAQRAEFDFSDLLQNLYYALQAPGGRLAQAICQQYPIALVDEFQDTDPWQYGALSTIYGDSARAGAATGLIMIGDPKQAIYSFRGADLATYLAARQQAQAIYTLSGNHRSTEGVVQAVNHVFARAHQPFGAIPFEPVQACNASVQPLRVNGQAQTAMTVWHLQPPQSMVKDALMRHMAHVFASQMVHLLRSDAATPGEMAVLVRDRKQASAMREALAQRGVRSVYLSERDSVFASPEARDVWRILRAVIQPRSTALVRAALSTALWGWSWTEQEALIHNEAAWDSITEHFQGWQAIWQRQGFLPMLHHLLHDQSIPARLLQGTEGQSMHGERQLTNVLHLGDLLQAASLRLQGEGALLRYLEDQMRNPHALGDTAQLRLESDARLVQIITSHKSKGLQYPLVFLPFVSFYRAEKANSGIDDASRLAEDMRLLYVGLTRAERALWLGVTQVYGDMDGKTPKPKSALSQLLGRQSEGDLSTCLHGWQGEHIAVHKAPESDVVCYTPASPAKVWKAALQPRRTLTQRWWSASFSALVRDLQHEAQAQSPTASERDDRLQDAQIDNPSFEGGPLALEGPDAAQSLVFNAFPAGSSYGTLLHDILEWKARNGWSADTPAALLRSAQRLGLDDSQQQLLLAWVAKILHTPLSETAIVLGAAHARQYWAEMGFCLKVGSLNSTQIDLLIQRDVLPDATRPHLNPRLLSGMLTGFMDLVLEHQGRYYVLDYKSNKLPDYGPAQLQQAILAHRYDVQYTLYLLALHRLLRHRLPGYDYDVHVGGALYLFLRGIDQPGCGLFVDCPPKALIEALDAAFAA